MAELFVPYGESRQVILPDGSQVWVDAGSLLVYPKDFTDTETRTVYLTGEASFTVRKTRKTFYCEDDLSGRAGFGYGIYSSFLSS